jgi:uncharacterized protein YyaL (SSP411 family)
LLENRAKRIRPGLDDKILLGWNALMSSGLVDAYNTFGEEDFLILAKRNIDFILENMLKGNVLFHSFGKKLQAYMDDYALFIQSLIDMYQATFDEQYLNRANTLTDYVMNSFYDEKEFSFFFTSRDSEKLIVDKKEMFDNVIPASNSVMANNLIKLGTMMDKQDYHQTAQSMLSQVYKVVTKQPNYMSNWAIAFHLNFYAPLEIIIIGTEALAFKAALSKQKLPNYVIMGAELASDLPLLEGRKAIDGKTTIYVCQHKTCQLPVFSVEEALVQIQDMKI